MLAAAAAAADCMFLRIRCAIQSVFRKLHLMSFSRASSTINSTALLAVSLGALSLSARKRLRFAALTRFHGPRVCFVGTNRVMRRYARRG